RLRGVSSIRRAGPRRQVMTSRAVPSSSSGHQPADVERVLVRDLPAHEGEEGSLVGWMLTRRDLGGIRFLLLRDRSGVVQVVLEGIEVPLHESSVRVSGRVVAHPKAPGGFEVQGRSLEVISAATVPPPVELSKEEWTANPDTL